MLGGKKTETQQQSLNSRKFSTQTRTHALCTRTQLQSRIQTNASTHARTRIRRRTFRKPIRLNYLRNVRKSRGGEIGSNFYCLPCGCIISELPSLLLQCILASIIVVSLKSLFLQFRDLLRLWKVSKIDFVSSPLLVRVYLGAGACWSE